MEAVPSEFTKSGCVLVADNDSVIRGVLRSILTKLGQRVEEARDTGEALSKAESRTPDLVILDLDMPGDGGLQACRQLRRNPATASLPVVILTGHSAASMRQQCLEAGATLFVSKPFNPAQLAQQLRPFLQLGTLGSAALADIVLRDRGLHIEDAVFARLRA